MRSLRTELSASIAASLGVLVVALIGGQMLLATTTPATATAAPTPMMSCLQQPLRQTGATSLHGDAHLCFSVDDVEVTVELTSAPSGDLHTAWMGFYDRPSSGVAGACPIAHATGQVEPVTPSRVDAGVVASDGAVRLSHILPSLRPGGNTELEILVVDHGSASTVGTTDRTRQLLSWDRAWLVSVPSATALSADAPRLVACAAFWLRGGAELTDH
jgi:hypothetical protein